MKYVPVKFKLPCYKFDIPIVSAFCNGQPDARRRKRAARFRKIKYKEKRGV